MKKSCSVPHAIRDGVVIEASYSCSVCGLKFSVPIDLKDKVLKNILDEVHCNATANKEVTLVIKVSTWNRPAPSCLKRRLGLKG